MEIYVSCNGLRITCGWKYMSPVMVYVSHVANKDWAFEYLMVYCFAILLQRPDCSHNLKNETGGQILVQSQQ